MFHIYDKKIINVTSHALYPLPFVTNCHTLSDPFPLERDVLYGSRSNFGRSNLSKQRIACRYGHGKILLQPSLQEEYSKPQCILKAGDKIPFIPINYKLNLSLYIPQLTIHYRGASSTAISKKVYVV